jgi:hypothetical protein
LGPSSCANLDVPWRQSLDRTKARRKASLERDCGTQLKELEKALGEEAEWTSKAQEARGKVKDAMHKHVKVLQGRVAEGREHLGSMREEIAKLRESDGNVDRFLDAHPEAALDFAAEVQLERQRERVRNGGEQARAAKPRQLERAVSERGPEISI